VKFMLLMWSDGSYAGGDAAEDYAAWADYETSLKADGVCVESGQFADVSDALSVETDLTASNGEGGAPSHSSTTGRSGLVGYYLLECADRDAAVRHARRAPLYGSVDVRELAAQRR